MRQETKFKANPFGREVDIVVKIWTDTQGTFRWDVNLSGDSL